MNKQIYVGSNLLVALFFIVLLISGYTFINNNIPEIMYEMFGKPSFIDHCLLKPFIVLIILFSLLHSIFWKEKILWLLEIGALSIYIIKSVYAHIEGIEYSVPYESWITISISFILLMIILFVRFLTRENINR